MVDGVEATPSTDGKESTDYSVASAAGQCREAAMFSTGGGKNDVGKTWHDEHEKVTPRGISGGFDVVLTSPPYPGVYDYLSYARYARSQLGALPRLPKPFPETSTVIAENALSSSANGDGGNVGGMLKQQVIKSQSISASVYVDSPVPSGREWPSGWTDGEIGSKSEGRRRWRNSVSSHQNPEAQEEISVGEAGLDLGRNDGGLATKWTEDQREWLAATACALRAGGGRMAVMVGDGENIDTRLSLLQEVEALGKGGHEGRLEVVGWATFRKAEGAKRSMRTEHLILLEKS